MWSIMLFYRETTEDVDEEDDGDVEDDGGDVDDGDFADRFNRQIFADVSQQRGETFDETRYADHLKRCSSFECYKKECN